jgi:hypothetical protein
MPLVYKIIHGDLFSAPTDTSLAHCVSQDMQMSKGIAKLFRDKFARIDNLKKQGTTCLDLFYSIDFVDLDVQLGGCAYLNLENRYVFYLVTKEKYFHKPTMSSLESSLRAMRDLCIENNIHHLAMPRIGCGLDKLNWDKVSDLIQSVFKDDDIKITIYAN